MAWLASWTLLYVGTVPGGIAVLSLAIPAWRRKTWVRRAAYSVLAIDGVLLAASIPVLVWDTHRFLDWVHKEAATYHLAVPRTFAGTEFPAGSTVHLRDDGTPNYGELPIPTTILGLPIVGEFFLGNHYGGTEVGITLATLAVPTLIYGIPCGPGSLIAHRATTQCVLAEEYEFAGHRLAMGQPVTVHRRRPNPPDELASGTLARPELLFGATWPAGTILFRVTAPPEQMVDGSEPDMPSSIQLCLPPGLTAAIPGATLHGLIGYEIYAKNRIVVADCPLADRF